MTNDQDSKLHGDGHTVGGMDKSVIPSLVLMFIKMKKRRQIMDDHNFRPCSAKTGED